MYYLLLIIIVILYGIAGWMLLRADTALPIREGNSKHRRSYTVVGILCLAACLYRLYVLIRWIGLTSGAMREDFSEIVLPFWGAAVLLIAPAVFFVLVGIMLLGKGRISFQAESYEKSNWAYTVTGVLCIIACVLLLVFEVIPGMHYLYPSV